MNGVLVKQLAETDVDDLRALRLEALRLHPESFSADLDLEKNYPTGHWLPGLRNGNWFGVRDGGVLCAMIALRRQASQKTRHVGEVASVYVRASLRGRGVGDALLHAIIDRASHDLHSLQLTVNGTNTHAIALYERHGFREVGRLPDSLMVDGSYYDELVMMRRLAPTD